jgi:hypothetical protein
VEHSVGKDEVRVMAILRFEGGSPRLCQLRTASFWHPWQALICTDRMSGLWAPVNLVASNYFVKQYLPASRVFVGGRMRRPGKTAGPDDPWGLILHPRSRGLGLT